MSQRILITGGSSLIGRELAVALNTAGHMVRLFQRGVPLPPPQLAAAAATGTDAVWPPDAVEVLQGDVRDSDAVARAVDGCDTVVHLAAKVGVAGDPDEYRQINVDGTVNVIQAAQRAGLRGVVHVSSPSVAHDGGSIVGGPAAPPARDHSAPYPATKAEAERRALAADDGSFGVVAIRPHLVWGPGDTQLVGRIVDRARSGRLALVGGGVALVDTTVIDNAVDALAAAAERVAPGADCAGNAYVIANGEPRPIRELIEGICAAAGVACEPRSVPTPVARGLGAIVEAGFARFRPDEEPPLTKFLAEQLGTAHWFDLRPAQTDLGWAPRITIAQGLERLAAWYAADRTAR